MTTVADLPISEARDNLAEVVNKVAYGGEVRYLTRRGRRLAVLASLEAIARTRAEALESVAALVKTALESLDENSDGKPKLRELLDELVELIEDEEDIAAAEAALARIEAGEPTVPWEEVRARLGL